MDNPVECMLYSYIMRERVHMPSLQKRSDLINLEQYENLYMGFAKIS
jgi:hypothetical protein